MPLQVRKRHRGTAPPIPTISAKSRYVVNTTTQPLYPQERDPVLPIYRRLGRPQDRCGRVRKISPPTTVRTLDSLSRGEILQCHNAFIEVAQFAAPTHL